MLSELAIPPYQVLFFSYPSDLMKSAVVDESLSSMNLQFCSRENQLLSLFTSLSTKVTYLLNCGHYLHTYTAVLGGGKCLMLHNRRGPSLGGMDRKMSHRVYNITPSVPHGVCHGQDHLPVGPHGMNVE